MLSPSRERVKGMGGLAIYHVMTRMPVQLPSSATVLEAAEAMRARNVGAVLVTDESGLCGVVTDRDIVVRAVAMKRNPSRVKIGDICSREIWSLSPSVPVGEAAQLMREKAIRRLPVLDAEANPVGMVSLGDLALCLDRSSVLSEISAAQPNH